MDMNDTLCIFTLRQGKELHLETPDWYFNYAGNITIRTPDSTHVIYNKEAKSNRPFTKDFLKRHYLSKTPSDVATNTIENNQVSIKPFGEDERVFDVLITEDAVTEYCSSYPPLTIVDKK